MSYVLTPPPFSFLFADTFDALRMKPLMVAMRDIKKGKEVTFDYSTSESEDGWYLLCHCGEKNCRCIIMPYEFLSKELKLKYRDFVSEYLKGILGMRTEQEIRDRIEELKQKLKVSKCTNAIRRPF